jgi:hypothetical protein
MRSPSAARWHRAVRTRLDAAPGEIANTSAIQLIGQPASYEANIIRPDATETRS